MVIKISSFEEQESGIKAEDIFYHACYQANGDVGLVNHPDLAEYWMNIGWILNEWILNEYWMNEYWMNIGWILGEYIFLYQQNAH